LHARTVAVDEVRRLDAGLKMLAVIGDRFAAFVEGDRRRAGRARQAFLQSGAHGVELPRIDINRHAAKRGGCVGIQNDVARPTHRADLGERLRHRGRGVAMHHREDARLVLLDRVLDLVRREHRAPFASDGGDVAAAALRDLGEQMAEAAEDRHQHLVARRNQRHEDGLDADTRGAVHHQWCRSCRR